MSHSAPIRFAGLFCLTVSSALLLLTGCDQPLNSSQPGNVSFNAAGETPHHLGWMGGLTRPIDAVRQIPDPAHRDLLVSPGGVVIVKTEPDSPLALAGAKPGDVVVSVAGDWLPIKEDPTLELVAAVEDQIAAAKQQIEIGVVRDGKFVLLQLGANVESLDEGLPLPVERLERAANSAAETLVDLAVESDTNAGSNEQLNQRLANHSISGLALLAVDSNEVKGAQAAVDAHLSAVSVLLDEVAGMDAATDILSPITSSWVAMFLAESPADLMQEEWLDRVSLAYDLIAVTQHPSGGWQVQRHDDAESTDESEFEEPDVAAAFATNQALLALGMLERKGILLDPVVVQRGVDWLHDQAKLRLQSSLDRRSKAALAAGNYAALAALNCNRDDPRLQSYLATVLDHSHEVFWSPEFGWSGLLASAVAARQSGNESWLRFHQATRHLGVMLQAYDGSVVELPGAGSGKAELGVQFYREIFRTTRFVLWQSMQSQRLEKLLAITSAENEIERDGDGKQWSGERAKIVADPGNNPNAEAIKQMILDQLKERGVDVDEAKLDEAKSNKSPNGGMP